MNQTMLYRLDSIRQFYNQSLVLEVDCLDIPQTCITGIYGPNGSGKSTLLRLLAFLEEPSQGTIVFKGTDCRNNSFHLRRQVALLDQSPYLLKRSVGKMVGYGLKVRGVNNRDERVREALNLVALDPDRYAKRMWYQLSGGEAQRVALASRIVLRPEALLLDEPTSNLDVESAERIRQASLAARSNWSTTVIVVSHDKDWLSSVSDMVVYMEQGQIKRISWESCNS